MTTISVAPSPPIDQRDVIIVLAIAFAAIIGAVATATVGLIALGIPLLVVVGAAFVVVMRRPILAAYVFAGALPFLGGIDRGSLIPLLRPSEALQAFLTAAVVAGAIERFARGEPLRVRFTKLDRAVVALAVLASVWPLFWQLARGQTPSSSDVFSTIVLWRLAGLYALFRWVVRTPEQIRRCCWIIIGSTSVLALLAVAQSTGLITIGGVWTPTLSGDAIGRGGATLNSSIAVGDYIAYTLAIVLVWLFQHRRPQWLLRVVTGVLVVGSLGTGQFSAWIAALIVLAVVVQHQRQLLRMARTLAPLVALGALVAGPVVATRLAGFHGGNLPQSWLGRIDNLTNFYLPRLAGFHWVFGVRPDSVLPAPETWRDAIFLESGLLWFFWVGGIPLFVAFCVFARRVLIDTGRVARARDDDVGVAALAARAAFIAMLVLTLIDMHLTLRGGGDLFFILLGLGLNQNVPAPADRSSPERSAV